METVTAIFLSRNSSVVTTGLPESMSTRHIEHRRTAAGLKHDPYGSFHFNSTRSSPICGNIGGRSTRNAFQTRRAAPVRQSSTFVSCRIGSISLK